MKPKNQHGSIIGTAGLTLLELMVVLIIVGLTTALVIPRFTSSLSRLDLKTSAQKTSSALRYARSQAVSKQITYYAVFDFEKNGCFISAEKSQDGKDSDFLTQAQMKDDDPDGLPLQSFLVQTYFLPENVRIEKGITNDKEFDSGLFIIEFYPSGNSSGGAVIFMDDKKRRFKINVNFITGMVNIEEPDQ